MMRIWIFGAALLLAVVIGSAAYAEATPKAPAPAEKPAPAPMLELNGNVLDQVAWGMTINDVLQRYLMVGKLSAPEDRYVAKAGADKDADLAEIGADQSIRPAQVKTVRDGRYAECVRFSVPIPEKVPHWFTLCAKETGGPIAWFMIDTDMTPDPTWIEALSSRFQLDLPWETENRKGILKQFDAKIDGVPTEVKVYWENYVRDDIKDETVHRSHLDMTFTNLIESPTDKKQ